MSIFPRANPPFYELFLNPNVTGTATIQTILSQPGELNWDNMISRKFRDGYMQQWNLDLQYEVAPNWMVDAAYVGSKGTHLPDPIDLNQTNLTTGMNPYPQFSSILDVESRSDSQYNALQVRSEKRVGHDLAFLASYTFSKSIDDVSAVLGGSVGSGLPQDSSNLSAERALSDFNAAHRAVLSTVYDLPGRKWAQQGQMRKLLLANWQTSGILTAQTGSPFTVNLSYCPQDQGAAAAFGAPCRPDLIANPAIPGPVIANRNPGCHATISQGGLAADSVGTPGSWFNTCAFAMPPTLATGFTAFGSAGRNILTGPGFGVSSAGRCQRLAGAVSKASERVGVADGDVREDLAVELHARELQAVHELRVGHVVLPRGSVDAGDPQTPEVALAVAPVAIAVLVGLEQRLLGHPVVAAGVAPEALGQRERRPPLLARVDRPLDASHPPCLRLTPSSVFTRGSSCGLMSAGLDIRRLRFGDFFSRM